MSRDRWVFPVLLLYAVLAALTIVFFDGNGNSGDSVYHYLYARYAPVHPELYFNHWAKPMYVLLASPFAQLGFVGVKVFNVLVALLSTSLTYKVARKLGLQNSLLVTALFICCPACYVLTFSGLTEPLFALFMISGFYAALLKRHVLACVLISFLPFVRSEGLIIIGAYGLYYLLKGQWKHIPWLLAGHVAYSLAGAGVHQDLFWVFNKIPYARLSSTYGSGGLDHFVRHLMYVVGVPIYGLFWLGTVAIIWKSLKKKVSLELQVLGFLAFFAFFIAHSIFWYLGIFNSMGLSRVLIGVAPLIAIIALVGFNFLTEELLQHRRLPRLALQGLFIFYVLIFPFTPNPASIKWDRSFSLSKDQLAAAQAATFAKKSKQPGARYLTLHPYLSELLEIDPFDEEVRLLLNRENIARMKPGDMIIWETWYAVVEKGLEESYLADDPSLRLVFAHDETERGRDFRYAVYVKE